MVKGSTTYKMLVPSNVEEKIRYLIRKFPHTEWSGVLFTTHEGSFEDGSLKIICKDIYPMDLGSAGWTEYYMSPDVTNYIAENLELFDCDLHLVHSHHSMGAFFSGQDNKMLQEMGNEMNCFVSLIVDTPGNYVAAVTRKMQKKYEVTTKELGTSYEFFGEGTIGTASTNGGPLSESTQVTEMETIEYYMLDVEVEKVDNSLDYLDRRFEEIERKKEEAKKEKSNFNSLPYFHTYGGFGNWDKYEPVSATNSFKNYQKEPTQLTFWDYEDVDKKETKPVEPLKKPSNDEFTPDPDMIDKCVAAIVTCSLMHLNPDTGKYDWKKFIKKDMDRIYKKLFPDYNGYSMDPFDQWTNFIMDFILVNYQDKNTPNRADLWNDKEVTNTVAIYIIDALTPYRTNSYIDCYCSTLEGYIEE